MKYDNIIPPRRKNTHKKRCAQLRWKTPVQRYQRRTIILHRTALFGSNNGPLHLILELRGPQCISQNVYHLSRTRSQWREIELNGGIAFTSLQGGMLGSGVMKRRKAPSTEGKFPAKDPRKPVTKDPSDSNWLMRFWISRKSNRPKVCVKVRGRLRSTPVFPTRLVRACHCSISPNSTTRLEVKRGVRQEEIVFPRTRNFESDHEYR
jgi:hypothetical protein